MGLYTWAIMLATACTTIWYGSRRATKLQETFAESMEVIEQNSVKTWTAIVLPIIGSLFLVLLFFFLDWLYYLLIALMAFAALIGVSFTFHPLFEWFTKKIKIEKEWSVRFIGPVTVSAIFSILFALGCVIAWIVTTFWILTDMLAICLAISSISFIRLPNLKIAFILLFLFFLYDIFWVFLSTFFFGKSVMESVATNLPALPMVIIFPNISLTFKIDGFSLLGVGDMVLPGLFLSFLYRYDTYQRENNIQPSSGVKMILSSYFWRALLFYMLGFILTIVILLVMNKGQPALLYLVPFTFSITCFTAYWRGEFKQLWKGIPHTNTVSPINEEGEGLLRAEQGEQTRIEEQDNQETKV